MLKPILATSALIAIAAVIAQPSSAADRGKFRQLVVEAPGSPTDAVAQKKKKFPALVVEAGKGIQTPTDTADARNRKSDGNKGAKFIVAPGGGIPTPGDTSDAGNGKAGDKVAQFVVAPGGGIPTPADTGGKGKPKKVSPTFAKAPVGIATPVEVADIGADPAPTGGRKTFPLIAGAPAGLPTPTADPAGAAGAATIDSDALSAVDKELAAAIARASGEAGRVGDEEKAAPVIASLPPAIGNPNDLYKLLTGHGYGVEVLKHDAQGNLVFYVTKPGNAKEADLLLVDATYGKVIERKHIAAYGYERPAPHAPRYSADSSGDDNCEPTAGYCEPELRARDRLRSPTPPIGFATNRMSGAA